MSLHSVRTTASGVAVCRFGAGRPQKSYRIGFMCETGNLDHELAATYPGRGRLMTRTLVLGHASCSNDAMPFKQLVKNVFSPESVGRIATSYGFEAVFSKVLARFKPRVFWWSDIQTGIDMDPRTL